MNWNWRDSLGAAEMSLGNYSAARWPHTPRRGAVQCYWPAAGRSPSKRASFCTAALAPHARQPTHRTSSAHKRKHQLRRSFRHDSANIGREYWPSAVNGSVVNVRYCCGELARNWRWDDVITVSWFSAGAVQAVVRRLRATLCRGRRCRLYARLRTIQVSIVYIEHWAYSEFLARDWQCTGGGDLPP